MKFDIYAKSDTPGIKLLRLTPESLEEAKQYPGSLIAFAFDGVKIDDLDGLISYLNSCLTKIGRNG